MSVETTASDAAPTAAPAGGDAPPGGPGCVSCRGLTRRFGEVLALAPMDLDLGPGGVTGLLGPNGSGKSTLLRCLVGLVRPDAGSARIDGVELTGDGVGIRRRVTYAPGELHLYGEMRGGDHIDWLLRGRVGAERARARSTAAELGLPLRKRVRGYSHGMKRQLCFAAALAPRVRVRLLDEPTEGLDPSRRSQVLDLLEKDAAEGTTVVLSSHHLGEVDRACDRLVFLSAGRRVADETPETVLERAGRVLRLTFAPGTDVEAVAARLAGGPVESTHPYGTLVTLHLKDRDPRSFLARLAEAADLPAPLGVEHGLLSLRELYRELYGEEGT